MKLNAVDGELIKKLTATIYYPCGKAHRFKSPLKDFRLGADVNAEMIGGGEVELKNLKLSSGKHQS